MFIWQFDGVSKRPPFRIESRGLSRLTQNVFHPFTEKTSRTSTLSPQSEKLPKAQSLHSQNPKSPEKIISLKPKPPKTFS